MSEWQPSDISFVSLVHDETDHPVATVEILTPAGAIKVMAELHEELSEGRHILHMVGTHVQTQMRSNALGLPALRLIARVALMSLGYDEIHIEGAPRTTGANKGHRPRVRFAR